MAALAEQVPGLAERDGPTTRADTRLLLRAVLIITALVAIASIGFLVEPSTMKTTDPELAQLLRGMAIIKGLILVAALAAVYWRFGLPIDRLVAIGYVVGIGLMAVATMMIWQLTVLLAAAIVFHIGLFTMAMIAWRGDEHRFNAPIADAIRRSS